MIYDLTFARLTTTINKDSHNSAYNKKYDAKDIKVIKDVVTKEEDIDEEEELKKLENEN